MRRARVAAGRAGLRLPRVMWTDFSHLYEREARRLLESQVREIEAPCVSAEPRLLHGPPVEAILDLCEELEPGLVVLGSRGRGPVGRLLSGSVAEGVVHHARFPVLVARGGAWPPERVVVGDDGSEDAGARPGWRWASATCMGSMEYSCGRTTTRQSP